MFALLFLLFVLAVVAAPPPGLDLDDLGGWSARADALLDGPAGCFEIEGQASVRVAVFTPGGVMGKPQRVESTLAGPFTGRLEDGLWTRLDHQLVPVDGTGKLEIAEVPVHPMVGRVSHEGEQPEEGQEEKEGEHGSVSVGMTGEGVVVGAQAWSQAANLVDEIIDAVDPDTVLVWASWDEDRQGVQVVQTMPLGRRAAAGEVTVRSLHPLDGGPERLDMELPNRIRMGDWPARVTLLEPQLHLVSLPTPHGPMPARESLSTILGVMGFTLGYEQDLAYHLATPCD